jgi:hypothetical protein
VSQSDIDGLIALVAAITIVLVFPIEVLASQAAGGRHMVLREAKIGDAQLFCTRTRSSLTRNDFQEGT